MLSQGFAIAGREIGADYPPYVIAEMSANHLGDKSRALAIVDAAARIGADAVKLQTYTADTMTLDVDAPAFQIEGGLWDGRKLFELYQEACTPWEWHAELFAHAKRVGIQIFSSPFDETSVDFLEELGAPAYKIASFELIDIPLIERVARTKKPIIMSTGMASVQEIEEALAAARGSGAENLMLLYCVSAYPAKPESFHLQTIPDMQRRFGVPIGLSDHSMGGCIATAAVALGAVAVEKHVTLARIDGGPDGAFSMEPDEMEALVRDVRTVWAARSGVGYAEEKDEARSRLHRRSLFAVADIAQGEKLSTSNIRSIRPGDGLKPKYMHEILGRHATRDVACGTPLSWDLID